GSIRGETAAWLSVGVGESTTVAQAVITPALRATEVSLASNQPSIATVEPQVPLQSPQTLTISGHVAADTVIDPSVNGSFINSSLKVAVYQRSRSYRVNATIVTLKTKRCPENTAFKGLKKKDARLSLERYINQIWDQALISYSVMSVRERTIDADL